MNEAWIVLEDEGQEWESWQWPVAVFTDKEAAEKGMQTLKEVYEQQYEKNVADDKLFHKEMDALPPNLTDKELHEEEMKLIDKYVGAHDEHEQKHFFLLQGPFPLNPIN